VVGYYLPSLRDLEPRGLGWYVAAPSALGNART